MPVDAVVLFVDPYSFYLNHHRQLGCSAFLDQMSTILFLFFEKKESCSINDIVSRKKQSIFFF